MSKFNKRTEVRFETAKEMLQYNKGLVLKIIKSEFFCKKIDLKEVATDFFNYVNKDFKAVIIEKKIYARAIEIKVGKFKAQYDKNFSTDHEAKTDFEDEIKRDMWNSKSM